MPQTRWVCACPRRARSHAASTREVIIIGRRGALIALPEGPALSRCRKASPRARYHGDRWQRGGGAGLSAASPRVRIPARAGLGNATPLRPAMAFDAGPIYLAEVAEDVPTESVRPKKCRPEKARRGKARCIISDFFDYRHHRPGRAGRQAGWGWRGRGLGFAWRGVARRGGAPMPPGSPCGAALGAVACRPRRSRKEPAAPQSGNIGSEAQRKEVNLGDSRIRLKWGKGRSEP